MYNYTSLSASSGPQDHSIPWEAIVCVHEPHSAGVESVTVRSAKDALSGMMMAGWYLLNSKKYADMGVMGKVQAMRIPRISYFRCQLYGEGNTGTHTHILKFIFMCRTINLI